MNTAILKICGQGKTSYRKKQDIRQVINYVLEENKRKKNDIWNTIGIFGSTKEDFAEDFHRLKRLYGKKDGLQLKHLVLSWGRRPNIPRKNFGNLSNRPCVFGEKIISWSMQCMKTKQRTIGICISSLIPYQSMVIRYR